jgi:glycine betaine catabolism B
VKTVRVAKTNDIQPSTMKDDYLAGERVCIVNIEGNYFAIGNVCTCVLIMGDH